LRGAVRSRSPVLHVQSCRAECPTALFEIHRFAHPLAQQVDVSHHFRPGCFTRTHGSNHIGRRHIPTPHVGLVYGHSLVRYHRQGDHGAPLRGPFRNRRRVSARMVRKTFVPIWDVRQFRRGVIEWLVVIGRTAIDAESRGSRDRLIVLIDRLDKGHSLAKLPVSLDHHARTVRL
jgi:hypothetical protein